jgi:hypothetical protein
VSERAGEDELITRVAVEFDVPAALLRDLSALESEFPDVNVWGVKPQIARRVEALLDAAAAMGDTR